MTLYIILAFSALIIILILNYKKIQLFIDYIKKQIATDFKKRTNLDWYTLKRLSAPKPFIWGLEKFLFNTSVLYFDDNYLYITKSNDPVIKHALSTITELRRTSVMINDKRIWKITINNTGKQIIYKFGIYRNFNLFQEKIRQNPDAIIDERYIWKIFE